MEYQKSDTTFWDERRGKIHTRKGGWIIGEVVHNQGYSTMEDLMGKKSFIQVLFLNVTGRIPERRLAEWLEARFLCVSWPDHRIWCNHIGSLAGTLRASPIAAVSAGILASDSRQYGPGTLLNTTRFITEAMEKKRKGMSVEETIETHPKRRPDGTPAISGFSRPIAKGDERIPAMERVTAKLGFKIGEHLALVYEISEWLKKKYDESMNGGAYVCAFMCDQGITGEEHYRLSSAVVHSGVLACYTETVENPPESFFPLHCKDSDYQGKPPRHVPTQHQII